MTQPVHAQPAARITDEQRALSDRSANLCRNRPAIWSAMVRYTDGLVRDGVPLHEARRLGLGLYDPADEQSGHLADGAPLRCVGT